MHSITDSLAPVGDLSAPLVPAVPTAWSDDALLAAQRDIGEVRRRLDALAASVAGEIAHRSRRELGHGGLAARQGMRSAEGLISQLTGTSSRDARSLVKAAELLPTAPTGDGAGVGGSAGVGDGEAGDGAASAAPPPSWLTVIGMAVAEARLSAEAAGVIRTRLGEAAARLAGDAGDGGGADGASSGTETGGTADDDAAAREELAMGLLAAAERLVAAAPQLTIEQLAARASHERDELDLVGIAAREEQRRAQRFLRVSRQLDGMTRITGLLDPESAAIVVPVLDAATSPRRGGPRFVDPDAVERADDIVRDLRTTEQLALDTLVELVRMGSRVDDGRVLGDRRPAVRILVTRRDLDAEADTDGRRAGAAFLEGHADAVSIGTAERHVCDTGAVPILFDDDGQVLNVGREQRLFTEKQRTALAARDGGCLMCDRPPSWTEAHHIRPWQEGGGTDIANGVLLCRFCHLLLHNRGWRITQRRGGYALERPDQHGTMRSTPLPTRSLAAQRLRDTA